MDTLTRRYAAIQKALVAAYEAGRGLSSATVGAEREQVIELLLKGSLPPPFRFGSGDIVDFGGHQTGQMDIVVEAPYSLGVPFAGSSERLYLAEGVAVVIEVKSNIEKKWSEVVGKAEELELLSRAYSDRLILHPAAAIELGSLPLYGVGFQGWKTIDSLRKRVPPLHGILIIDPGLFVARRDTPSGREYAVAEGPLALRAFILDVYRRANLVVRASIDTDYWGLTYELPDSEAQSRSTAAHLDGPARFDLNEGAGWYFVIRLKKTEVRVRQVVYDIATTSGPGRLTIYVDDTLRLGCRLVGADGRAFEARALAAREWLDRAILLAVRVDPADSGVRTTLRANQGPPQTKRHRGFRLWPSPDSDNARHRVGANLEGGDGASMSMAMVSMTTGPANPNAETEQWNVLRKAYGLG